VLRGTVPCPLKSSGVPMIWNRHCHYNQMMIVISQIHDRIKVKTRLNKRISVNLDNWLTVTEPTPSASPVTPSVSPITPFASPITPARAQPFRDHHTHTDSWTWAIGWILVLHSHEPSDYGINDWSQ
jgi:hypothetical protein